MKYFYRPQFITLLAMCLSQVVFAQLPKGLSEAEATIFAKGEYVFPTTRGLTTPPPGAVRTMAQWEELRAIVVTYTGYQSIVRQIIDHAQEECLVLVACTDSNVVKTDLTTDGIPLTNVRYIEVPYNSIWIRDYAGHTIYTDDVDSCALVEWIYNRPRPDDDVMPEQHAAYFGIPLYSTTTAPNNIMNTGGNWMVDGFGTAFASELILDENDGTGDYGLVYPNHTSTQVDGIMNDFMGINRYIKMPTLPYDGIHHIDMHMKLANEETLIWGEYPVGESDGPQIEANLAYVQANYNSMFGTPYKVVRIPQPPSTGGSYPAAGGYYRTYANHVIVNKTIIVPGYRVEYDTTAQRILEETYPGYTIKFIDVDNSGANLISQSGAIHCITNNIGVADPLLISHQELDDTYDDVNPYTVTALVKHRSGIAGATLYYSTDEGAIYTPVAMVFVSGDDYSAQIPAQVVGTHIKYYIQGNAVSGKIQVRPMVAPGGTFDFYVLAPVTVPENNGMVSINVFPNPAGAITCIDLNGNMNGNITVTLQNILAQQVEVLYNGTVTNANKKVFFDASMYQSGTYLVKVVSETGISVCKVVVK